jgi:hypothetical protein
MIVAGHGAQLAALELGLHKVPVDRQNFKTDADEQAAMLADNWLADVAVDYDKTLSAELIDELRDSGMTLNWQACLNRWPMSR